MKKCWSYSLMAPLMALVSAVAVVAGAHANADSVAELKRLESGRHVFIARDKGHCLLCHKVAQVNAPFQGNVGPDLSNVGARLNAQQIRQRIVDASRFNPKTIMPAYARTAGLTQVARAFQDKPILTPAEIDDLVAFVVTLQNDNAANKND